MDEDAQTWILPHLEVLRMVICFSKYMKKPGKAAGAAATTTESSSTPSLSTASATMSPLAKNSKQQADLLAQLMEKVKAQEAQIAVLKSSF